jgi:malate synthase
MQNIKVKGETNASAERVLTPEALKFLAELHQRFNGKREELLALRTKRQESLDKGLLPSFLTETEEIRNSEWQVGPSAIDLRDRRVEITGPVERKMMINALNSGAKVFMADFEDALSPTWENVIDGQINCMEAVRKTLSFVSPEGKSYQLNEQIATLVIRPRGWHLQEEHFEIEGQPCSASLFDFGLYFFHNAEELIKGGSGPYFYLPKLESHLEARLWNDVFVFSQNYLKIPHGTIRATVLIETILAAFEMEEILYELRDHAAALNAGRWDYIFSLIKKTREHKEFMLPDRAQVTMAVPFMRAYAQLLVKTCHKRGAHAIGGMAAFIPSRKDAEINALAFAKVTEDKTREAGDGFDGTWVAHPDLVPIARAVFDDALGDRMNQKHNLRADFETTADQLLNTKIEGAKVTLQGVISNIDVGLQYIESWLRGIGAAGIHNLMEDAATAEISRAQLWQWISSGTKLDNGEIITEKMYRELKKELLEKLAVTPGNRFADAEAILDDLVLSKEFAEFLTIPAYQFLKQK